MSYLNKAAQALSRFYLNEDIKKISKEICRLEKLDNIIAVLDGIQEVKSQILRLTRSFIEPLLATSLITALEYLDQATVEKNYYRGKKSFGSQPPEIPKYDYSRFFQTHEPEDLTAKIEKMDVSDEKFNLIL